MADFEAVASLWRSSGFETRPGDSRSELRRKLRRDPDLFLVAQEDSRIVGSVLGAWDGRRGWVYHLAVDPGHRRRHIAQKMLSELESRMKEKGVLKVNAMVYLWNDPSLSLFEGQGYNRQSDMVVMGKQLLGGGRGAHAGSGRARRRGDPNPSPSDDPTSS